MNLNTLKRGFTRTNPERGLRSLPGAQKSERRDDDDHSIRVKGVYIPLKHETAGRILGTCALGIAWICTGILISLFTLTFLPISWQTGMDDYALTSYVVLAVIMHILVIVADGITNSNAPRARKSVIVFWGSLALIIAIAFPIHMLMSLF